MSPAAVDTGVMLALVEVKIGGVAVPEERIQEVRVQDSLALPTAFSITFTPADLARGDDPLGVRGVEPKLGKAVVINLGAPRDRERQKLFDGEITALEPNYGPDGIRLVASGYDRAHRLHRGRHTKTYQQMSTTDIVRKLAGEAGLAVKADATPGTHAFVQQNNETNWEFLQRLASMHRHELVVDGSTLIFRKIPEAPPAPLALEYGKNASDSSVRLHSFYPRVSAAQQVKEVSVRGWDPKAKEAIVANAPVQQVGSAIGIKRDSVAAAFGASTITVADAPVTTRDEATALAESLAAHVGSMFVGAYGATEGNPLIRAGATLDIKGLGKEFSGTYRCSATTHVYGGGYSTTFEVLGRSPRDLLDLARPATRNVWGESLVIGVVSNNNDTRERRPAHVRVKYPTLDGMSEGAWARVVAVGAGPNRGQLMLPQVNDEVLIGFEGGDPHKPYVLGALWNGKDAPDKELLNPAQPNSPPDSSYVLRSPKLIDLKAVDNVKIKTEKDMIVEVTGKSTEKVDQTQEVTVKQSFKLDAGTELTLVCGQAKLVLKKDGTIDLSGANITVKGNGNVTVEGTAGAAVKGATVNVQGQGQVAIKGAQVAIN